MATAVSGRIICARCGANNFETQAACWKCGSPLTPALGGPAAMPATANAPGAPAAPVMVAAPVATVDPSVAHWVGIIGGLLIPIAVLPVGIAFLMWDDRRKVEVGRTATIASLVGTLIHAVFTYFAIYGLVSQGMKMLPGAAARASAARTEQSQQAPDWNAPAKPLDLSGIPSLSPPK